MNGMLHKKPLTDWASRKKHVLSGDVLFFVSVAGNLDALMDKVDILASELTIMEYDKST